MARSLGTISAWPCVLTICVSCTRFVQGKCKLGAALRVREVGTRPTTYTQVTTDQVSDLLEPHLAAAVEARRSMAPQPGPTQAAPVHGTA